MSRWLADLLDLTHDRVLRLERGMDGAQRLVDSLLLVVVFTCFATLFLNLAAGPFGFDRDPAFDQLRINYQGGFVRRGLLGETVWRLQHLTGVPANYWLGGLFGAIYAGLAVTLLSLLKEAVPRTAWRISLFLVPVGVLFAWQDPGAFLRADAIALLLIAAHARFERIRGWSLATLLSLSVLVHELQALLIPFHALLLLQRRHSLAPLVLPVLVCVVVGFNIGDATIAGTICASWERQGCPAYLDWGFGQNLKISTATIEATGPSYFFSLCIGLAPALLLMHNHQVSPSLRKIWWLAVGASTGLFLSGCDFGRWINLIALHGLLTAIVLIRGRPGSSWVPPPFMNLPSFRWFVASGYALLWYVPHVGSPGLSRGIVYRYLSYSPTHEPLYWLLLFLAALPLMMLILFWRQFRQLGALRSDN